MRLNTFQRNRVGTVYPVQVVSNIQDIPRSRNLDAVIQASYFQPKSHIKYDDNENEMTGSGIMDIVKNIYNTGKKLLPVAEKAYTSDVGTALRNLIPASDDTARPGFPGEKHMLLKLKNGKTGVANYMGPGTEISKRLARNDPGRTKSDKVAKLHDIQYRLSQNSTNTDEQLKKVRSADNRMIGSLKRLNDTGGDSQRNIQAGLRLIQLKTIAEDTGALDPSKFAGPLEKLSNSELHLLNSNEMKLEQQGLGPGQELKAKLLKKLKNKAGQNKKGGKLVLPNASNGLSASRTLPDTQTYNLNQGKLSGAGSLLKKQSLKNIVMDNIVPIMLKDLGIKKTSLNKTKLDKVVKECLKNPKKCNLTNNKLQSISKKLGKKLIPIIVDAKIKSGTVSQQSGKGIINTVKKESNKLQDALGKAIFKGVKAYLNHGSKARGLKPMFGSGIECKNELQGKGLFDFVEKGFNKFKKGITKTFKPLGKQIVKGFKKVAPILKTIAPIASIGATALGQPEIGLAIDVGSEFL